MTNTIFRSAFDMDNAPNADVDEDSLDVMDLFDVIDEKLLPTELRGERPQDYPGYEIQTVLYTTSPRYTAAKQYKPDPSGVQRATKVSDYGIGKEFVAKHYSISCIEDVFDGIKIISRRPRAFLIRGMLSQESGRRIREKSTGNMIELVRRQTTRVHGQAGDIDDVPRKLQMLDLDGVALPVGLSVIADPEACIKWVVDHLLPPEFKDVDFVYQLSNSAGLTKADNQLHVHLWFFTERPYWDVDLRAWANWWNSKSRNKIIDPMVFRAEQPLFTADPELLDGLEDPFSGRRLGLVRGRRRTVPLYMPTLDEIAEEARLRRDRARAAGAALGKIDRGGKPSSSANGRNEQGNASQESRRADERTNHDLRDAAEEGTAADDHQGREGSAGWDEDSGNSGEPNGQEGDDELDLGAVRLGPGWEGYLKAIGFEGHIRNQIRAAIGSYFYLNGSAADRRVLKDAIVKAIEQSPFLDCGEPWSRPRKDALDYLDGSGGISNVDEMIRDIAALQKEHERTCEEECQPAWSLPTLTVEQAFDQVRAAIDDVFHKALEFRKNPLQPRSSPFGLDPPDDQFLISRPPRIAVFSDPGVGKTEAYIDASIRLLREDAGARVAIAVPTHALGNGLAERINRKFGSEVAAEWYGIDAPDPRIPEHTMCRLADAAREVQASGGKLQLLCRGREAGHCPHHPLVVGDEGCGYMRQQLRDNTHHIRVWVVPSVMLAQRPPTALQRPAIGDFDVLVIDEAPWFGLLSGLQELVGAPVDWLSPDWWRTMPSRSARDKEIALEMLSIIHRVLAKYSDGEVTSDAFRAAGVDDGKLRAARRFVWGCKIDLRNSVSPGSAHTEVTHALALFAPINKRVMAVAQVLNAIRMGLRGQLAPSGMQLVHRQNEADRFLRLRWRKDIHPEWRRGAILYLDAAGTPGADIAKAWLPDLQVAVEARAAAPHMSVTQITDTQMSYHTIRSSKDSYRGTAEALARVIEAYDRSGLVVCPKFLRETWEENARLPKCGL